MARAATHAAPEFRSPERRPPVVPLWAVATVFWTAIAAVVLARAVGAPESEAIGTFGVIFTSIVVEALPFILIGAIASAALAAFVPDRAFARLGALPTPVQVPAAALAGLGMPVCECGSVPVGRRLILRGVHPSAGIAFMLAAPILNPIVLASTWVAYGAAGRAAEMTIARAVLGLTVAVAAGLLIGRGAEALIKTGGTAPDEHDHDHRSAGAFVEHLAADFLFMGRFLVLGAAVAALLQTAVPQDWLSSVADSIVIGALALMAMAVALSFLVLGPVVDAKLAVLYGATFRRRFVLQLLLVAVPVALAGALIFDGLFG
jgi:uncharacterized protein